MQTSSPRCSKSSWFVSCRKQYIFLLFPRRKWLSIRQGTSWRDFVGTFSEEFPIHLGVPQGSTLSPIIFITFMNVILTYLKLNTELALHCYADDLTISYASFESNLTTKLATFQTELNAQKNIYDSLRIALNVNKTEIMLFKSKNQPDQSRERAFRPARPAVLAFS